MIAVLLVGTVRSVGRRLMDGVEPELVERAERALGHLAEVESVERVRMRWVGHRLHGDALVRTSVTSLADADRLAAEAEGSVKQHMPNVDEMAVQMAPKLQSVSRVMTWRETGVVRPTPARDGFGWMPVRSEEHTSELQSRG